MKSEAYPILMHGYALAPGKRMYMVNEMEPNVLPPSPGVSSNYSDIKGYVKSLFDGTPATELEHQLLKLCVEHDNTLETWRISNPDPQLDLPECTDALEVLGDLVMTSRYYDIKMWPDYHVCNGLSNREGREHMFFKLASGVPQHRSISHPKYDKSYVVKPSTRLPKMLKDYMMFKYFSMDGVRHMSFQDAYGYILRKYPDNLQKYFRDFWLQQHYPAEFSVVYEAEKVSSASMTSAQAVLKNLYPPSGVGTMFSLDRTQFPMRLAGQNLSVSSQKFSVVHPSVGYNAKGKF